MLAAQHISKSVGTLPILRDVSVAVSPGTITVVMGPSGGGKTTLLRAVSLLDPPTTGTVEIDEKSFSFPSTADYAPWPDVTIVFQQLFLWPHLTLRQNIELPLKLRQRTVDAAELERGIDVFQLRDVIDNYPNQASTGERQRAALLRATTLRPKYLLLDEVTSALDIEQVAVLLTELQALRAKGIGILLVTHLLSFARQTADRVYFLERGEMVVEGSADILTHPKHPRLQQFLSRVAAAM